MLRHILLRATLVILVTGGLVTTGACGAPASQESVGVPAPREFASPVLMREIVNWLSRNFDLSPSAELPRIEFTSPERITSITYHGLVPAQASNESSKRPALVAGDIVAVYVTVTRTIYLPVGWRDTSPTDVSVLVHEMVHHLQNQAGIKYPCYQAREKLAYAAQDRWLAQYGLTLQGEFEVDKLTLLIRTNCGM